MGIVRPSADLTILVGLDYTDGVFAAEEANMLGTDLSGRSDQIQKTRNGAEVSS